MPDETNERDMTIEERVARLERTFQSLGSHAVVRDLRNDVGKLFALYQAGDANPNTKEDA